jgi:hypothetical protein
MAGMGFDRQFARLCAKHGSQLRYFRTLLFIVYLFKGKL